MTVAETIDDRSSKKSNVPTERYILIIFLFIYLFSAKGYLQVSDTAYSVQTADAVVVRGRLDIPHQEAATLQGRDGHSYSKYGIGLPMYYIPWVAVSHALSSVTGFPTATLTGFLLSFANIPFALLTLHLFGRCLRLFGVDAANAWLLVIGLGFGTLCWPYAGYDFSEAMQTSLLLLAAYGVLHRTSGALIVGGLGFAGLILVKLVHVALLPVFLVYLVARPRGPRQLLIREVALFALPVVLAVSFIAFMNTVRFGSPLESGYGSEASLFYPIQLLRTVPKLLISFDKGLFIFCPILVLGLFGWVSFAKRHAMEAALCGALIICNLLLAGSWHSWEGGWSWGPRLLVPTIPFWLLPAAFWLDSRRSKSRFTVAAIIMLISIVAQIPGVLVKDQEIHHIKWNMLTPEERALAMPDYPVAWRLLSHKLSASNQMEVYRISEFGIPSDRELDLTEYRSFQGLNLWTEHAARYFNRPTLRWLPIIGLLVIGYCVLKVVRRRSKDIRT